MTEGEYLLVLGGALLFDLLLGDPPNRWHPVAWLGAFIAWSCSWLPKASPRWARLSGGAIAIGGALVVALLLALAVRWLGGAGWIGLAVQAFLLKLAFSVGGLTRAGARVQRALAAGDLTAARKALSHHLVSRPTARLSPDQVASGAIESLAENLTDSIVAPLLAFALGGLPAAWAYRFINTADAMIGYRTEEYKDLGGVAARLDDALNWGPARVAGPLVVAASAVLSRRGLAAWRTMRSQHSRTASPNAGWTMAAAAGGLGVHLEKPGHHRLEGGMQLPGAVHLVAAGKLVWVVAAGAGALTALIGGLLRVGL